MNKAEPIKAEIASQYKRAQELAKEIWLGEDETEDASSRYYFQCGFIAGLSFLQKQNKGKNKK